jgi:hypothetical protein
MGVLTINGFTDREFTAEELTTVMVDIPNMYTAVTQMGIFKDPLPLPTTYVAIEIDNMVLNLLPVTERGAPATKGSDGKRKRRLIEIPMSAHEELITVGDLQNLIAFGSKAPMMLEDAVNRRLLTMVMKHQLTHEWRRIGALSGKILDSDGSTLLDLFSEFGVSQQQVPFGGASSFNEYVVQVKRHIEDNLRGDTMTMIGCLCSPEFFDMILTDTDVKAAYNAAAAMMRLNPNIDDVRPGFLHQGVYFAEYRGSGAAKNADGTVTTRKFIPAGDARFFPMGTMQSSWSYTAPGDFLEALNMPGQLFYAKSAPVDLNRGLLLHTQSAFLPIWTRPATLVRGHTGSSN